MSNAATKSLPDIEIGKSGRTRFGLPAEVQTQTIAVLGIRGSGKTNTGVCIVEELLAGGAQVIVIDPTDVWWGLKSSRDGRSDGYPIVVLGGAHGDVPLKVGDGATIADFLVDHPAPAILSLRHLRKGDQRRLVTDFAEQLYHRKGEASKRTPLLVVIDECDAFVPQRVGGAEARMVGAIEDLVRRGRSSGLGVMLISQRAASVNKDVLTQLELLIAHRHTSPHDAKALRAWVEQHDLDGNQEAFFSELASLPVGTAWFWSPGWLSIFERVAVRERRTFDSSATPRAGKNLSAPQSIAVPDLAALRKNLSATIAEAEANDPKALRRRIIELEREDKGRKPAIDEQAIERIVDERDRHWQAEFARVARALHEARAVLESAEKTVADRPDARPRDYAMFGKRSESNSKVAATTLGRDTVANPSLGNSGKRRILVALVQHGAMSRSKLSILTGISATGGTMRTYLGELKTLGYLEGGRDSLSATNVGVGAVGDYEPLPAGQALIDYWRDRLGKSGKRRIFDALVSAYPLALSRAELASRTGIDQSGGTFRTYVGELKTLRLITGRGELSASEDLFS